MKQEPKREGEQARSHPQDAGTLLHALVRIALPCVLGGGHALAVAQTPVTLEEVRVSASALPVTAAAASQHVTVLTRADLDALGQLSVAEALARQAGIVVDRSPRSGGYGSLYLRGADPSHVVVLVDHVRQNDPLSSRGSAVDLNTLSTGDVERIEIVRGNVSVVHAEALAGLIHIFTRRAAGTGYAGVAVGGDGLRAAQAGFAGAQLRGSISHREDGDKAGGFNRTQSANAAWEQPLDGGGSVTVSARVADSLNRAFPDDSGGAEFAVLRQLDSRRATSGQLSARAAINTAASGRVELQATTLSRDGDEVTSGVAPGVRDPFGLPAMTTQTDYRRHEVQALWLPPTNSDLQVTLGIQHQRETGKLASNIDFGFFALPADFELSRSVTSLMAEARYQWGSWTLQGGLRHERPDAGDAATHPMLSVQHALGDALGHWGVSVSRATKLPSFYALAHPLVGNPLLRTERATHRELYYASPQRSAWPSRVTLFSARYKDLIDFDAGPPPQLVNRARINADGVEWRTGHTWDNGWRLRLDGTVMRVRDPEGITELRHRPHAQWSAQLNVPWGPRRDFTVLAKHVGRRLDSSIPTGDQQLAAVNTVDISARMPVGAAIATLAVDNLANSRSAETIGTPTPSRRLRLALNWSLP
ncbi:TonB-dependent siderophore receptor [Ramlibacter sp. WS9]|uniref:TonB-dependent receptor plug domain-containing protein n=1 Tax=Ramlibacter sp. WS9 TaxID=1882741 RepID=UPI0013053A12|nr:TonB-dependent receptor plug domain-containing protein [Ramlibacter sp. WS9]